MQRFPRGRPWFVWSWGRRTWLVVELWTSGSDHYFRLTTLTNWFTRVFWERFWQPYSIFCLVVCYWLGLGEVGWSWVGFKDIVRLGKVCARLCVAVWGYVKLCEIMWGCVRLCEIMWSCARLCVAVWVWVKLCGIVWGCVRLGAEEWIWVRFC